MEWLRRVGSRFATRLRDPWQLASWIGLCFLLGCVAAFSTDAGLIWDEPLQVEYGDRIVRWFASGFRDRSAMEYRDLYLYGGLFDAPAQWLVRYSPLGVYETRHVLTALCALLGIVAVYRIAARLGGARAGFFAGALLFLTPPWTGHGLFNPKDIPFGTAVALVCDACVAIALGPAIVTWQAALYAGACVGLALAVRSGGMFLAAYLACVAIGRATLGAVEHVRAHEPLGVTRTLAQLARLALRIGVALALAWLLMLSFWPWAQVAPFTRPLEAAREAAQFDWAGDVLFNGRIYAPWDLPRSYLPKWLAMTLPEFYALALLAGCFALAVRVRSKRSQRRLATPHALASAFLVAAVCAPVLGVLVKRPIIYDAQRHFLFLMPPLAALSGFALSECFTALERRAVRTMLATLFLVCALSVAHDMIALHPYEYVYFNRSFGGLARAAGRFETDYWGASYAAGLEWLVRHVQPNRRRKLRITNCSTPLQTSYYLERIPGATQHFEFVEDHERADLLIATTRYNCHKVPGEVLQTIDREGVPLVYVIRLPPKPKPPREHRPHGRERLHPPAKEPTPAT